MLARRIRSIADSRKSIKWRMDEPNFRRKEDDDWIKNVDHQLVTLMTALQVVQENIKQLFKQQREDAITLSGNRQEDGLIKRMKDVESAVRRVDAVLFMDSTGKRGLVKDVEQLYAGESKADRIWTNATKVIVALIMSGFLIQNWT